MISFLDAFSAAIFAAIDKLPGILLTILAAYIGIRVIKYTLRQVLNISRISVNLREVLLSVADILLWLLVLALILYQLGFTQIATVLTGSVAIVTIAISFSTTTLLQDIISGIFLAQDKDFKIGETIRVNDITGEVLKMDARKVRLKAADGQIYVLPNSMIDKAAWTVIGSPEAKNKSK